MGETRDVLRSGITTRLVIVLGASSLLASVGGNARADEAGFITAGAPTAAALARYAGELGASDRELRRTAAEGLSHLPDGSLPALRERFTRLLATRPAHEDVLRVLTLIRHAGGSRRADDETDLAAGVLPALEHDRSAAMLAVVEPLLYLRAIEAANDIDTQLELARYVSLDDGAFQSELLGSRRRRGVTLLPAWIILRSHENAVVRRFAQATVSALGMDDPRTALAQEDPFLVASIVRAYVTPLDFSATPLIVRMVNDTRIEVRQAARFAVSRFGKNAIWPVRELYEEVSGQAADKSWDFARSTNELYAVLDRPELEDAATLLSRGEKSLAAHDLAAMQHAYDTLLAKYPDFADKEKLAPGYSKLGAARFEEDDLEAARAAYQRAVRLAPNTKDAQLWRAQLAYVSAELSLSHGIVDLAAYDQALTLDPTLAAAREARDRLSGEKKRRQDEKKRWSATAALALLLALTVLALKMRPRPVPTDAPATDATS